MATLAGHPVYLKITIGGTAVDGNSTERDGFVEGITWSQPARTNYQQGSNLSAGSIQYEPITFTSETGKHTPKLIDAHANHKTVVIEAEHWRYNSDGTRAAHFKTKVENARVVAWTQNHDATVGSHATETWQVVGGKFTWTATDGNIEFSYDLGKRA